MKILIVAATEMELEPIKNLVSVDSEIKHEITFLIAGVGMINTTYHITKLLSKNRFDVAINIGIAGAFDRKLNIGDVLHIKSDLFAEMGAEDDNSFLSLIQLGLQTPKEFPFLWGELVPEQNIISEPIAQLQKVSGITVNKTHGKLSSILQTQNLYNPQTESMEGAAFFFCCMNEKIPCVQIRSISNYVEKRNKDNWNIPLALKNLQDKILELLTKI